MPMSMLEETEFALHMGDMYFSLRQMILHFVLLEPSYFFLRYHLAPSNFSQLIHHLTQCRQRQLSRYNIRSS